MVSLVLVHNNDIIQLKFNLKIFRVDYHVL